MIPCEYLSSGFEMQDYVWPGFHYLALLIQSHSSPVHFAPPCSVRCRLFIVWLCQPRIIQHDVSPNAIKTKWLFTWHCHRDCLLPGASNACIYLSPDPIKAGWSDWSVNPFSVDIEGMCKIIRNSLSSSESAERQKKKERMSLQWTKKYNSVGKRTQQEYKIYSACSREVQHNLQPAVRVLS